MLLPHIIAALPLAVAALPGLPRRTPLLVHLADSDNCRINLGSRQYDLYPLLGGTEVRSLTTTDDQEATYVFRFGADADPESSSSGHHCPPSGTGVYVFHGRPSDSDPIIYDTSSTVVSVDPAESSEFLTLQFSGTQGITARLRLVCDSRAHLPTYTGTTTGGVPLFTWRTQHGCALPPVDALLRVHSTEESGSEGETPPPNPNGETPEQGDNNSEDRLMDDGRQRASRRSTAVILFFISFAIISLSILSYKHPHRISLFLSTYVKPLLPARSFPRISLPHSLTLSSLSPLNLKPAGEGRLIRWAHEDLELDESEDFMVNGTDDDGAGAEEDEQIPLRPSPRKGGGGAGVKTYGSAPPSPFW